MTTVPSVKLSSGYKLPMVGLGTWLSKPGEVQEAVVTAITTGYRHIDCAMAYGNHAEVGRGIQQCITSGKVKREDLFVTSKIWNTFHSFDEAQHAVDMILADLQLDYLDLCLIHWPQGYKEKGAMFPKDENGVMQNSDEDYLTAWRGLEAKVDQGKIRSIGVSNFNHKQLQRIIDNCTIKPVYVQFEMHPYFPQSAYRAWLRERGIVYTAYSPLANPTHMFRKEGEPLLLEEPILTEIAKTHSKSPAQVALRWAVQKDAVVIPKSVSQARIKQNFEIFDFQLSDDEMKRIDSLDRNWRILVLERDLKHPHYPFSEPF